MMVQETSIKTYHDIEEEGLLGEMQIKVYTTIKSNPNNTDKENATMIGMPINCYTGRRNELVDLGLVESKGKRHCSISGRYALVWGLVERKKEEIKKPSRCKCEFCNGRGYFYLNQLN